MGMDTIETPPDIRLITGRSLVRMCHVVISIYLECYALHYAGLCDWTCASDSPARQQLSFSGSVILSKMTHQ